MDWKRTAMLGVFGATLVTLLARVATSSLAPVPIVVPPSSPTSEDPALLFADIDRLRERLRAPVAAATPARNLFTFRSAAAPRARAVRGSAHDVAAVPTPAASPSGASMPPLTFVGLADDTGPSGPVRTAILSGAGGLYFAEVGAVVAGYRVTAIRDDAVVLTGAGQADENTPVVLTFK